MNIGNVREKLLQKGFNTMNDIYNTNIGNILVDASMEAWCKDNRVIILKDYINKFHFNSWAELDKTKIVSILKLLSSREKNNLYFIINLNTNLINDISILEQINKLEKDDKICKKYVLVNDDDIERIPFLSDSNINSPQMLDYENKFKQKLKEISGISENSIEISIKYFDDEE